MLPEIKMSFEKPVVVIDNGSYNIKAGFACDNHPVSIFRTIVGRPSYLQGTYGTEPYEVYIGDDAVSEPDLELNRPVVDGRIMHWDNMERVWHHIFYRELKAAPEDRAIILACSPTASMDEKIKCCEIFFETLNIPGLCIQPQSVLAVYGSGYTTGICVDLGYDTCDINPVYEGGLITYAQMQTKLSGKDIYRHIEESFVARNLHFGAKTADVIEGVMKDCLYLTQNVAMSRRHYKRIYRLSRGKEVDVSQEAFMIAEMMFQPDLVVGKKTDIKPIQEAVMTSAIKCDSDLRSDLYEAIIPCGGLSMIPGFLERLTSELEALVRRPVNVVASSEAYITAWLGGAIFAGLPNADKMWVMKKQYDEHGARIVKNKFM